MVSERVLKDRPSPVTGQKQRQRSIGEHQFGVRCNAQHGCQVTDHEAIFELIALVQALRQIR